ncbi:MAG: serine hydrolase [Planctomycetota bacterium]
MPMVSRTGAWGRTMLAGTLLWGMLGLGVPLAGFGNEAHAQAAVALEPDLDRVVGDIVDESELGRFWGAVLVRIGDDDVLARGYGFDDELLRPIDLERSLFDVGSIAKSFTAACVLAMVDRGELTTATTLGEVFGDDAGNLRGVTVEELMGHRSGLGEAAGYALGGPAIESPDDLVARLATSGVGSKRFQYSNAGYFLLAAIIEKVAGEPFEAAVRSRVFAPAGLDGVGFVGDGAVPGARPTVRMKPPPPSRTWKGSSRGTLFGYPWNWGQRGATGVVITARSLADWVEGLTEPGRVLSAESLDAMMSPGAGGYGLGWYVDRDARGVVTRFAHGGSTGGYRSEVARYPEAFDGLGATVVVLTGYDGDARGIAAAIRRELVPQPSKPMHAGVFLSRHADFEQDGTYTIGEGLEWRVLARYVGSGPNGERILDERPTIILDDSSRGIWAAMIRLDRDDASELVQSLEQLVDQTSDEPGCGATAWSKGLTLVSSPGERLHPDAKSWLLESGVSIELSTDDCHDVLSIVEKATGDVVGRIRMGGAENRQLQWAIREALK